MVLDSTSLRSTWNSLCVSLYLQSVFEQKMKLICFMPVILSSISFKSAFTIFRSTWNSLCVSLFIQSVFEQKMKSVCFDIPVVFHSILKLIYFDMPVVLSSIFFKSAFTNLSSTWNSFCVSLFLQSAFLKSYFVLINL